MIPSIAHYRIAQEIGRGGMGVVYRAHDTKLGRDVAIKLLPPSVEADPERATRLEREARVMASLNHPHIGAIYGLEHATGPDGAPVTALVLELVEGPTLADRLAAGALPLADALKIARQIADALEAAHERGVVHRDLKPGNVKLTPGGDAKVLDFGLAKLVGREDAGGDTTTTITGQDTQAGTILGTPRYMSPEQARGLPVDKRTDIWSFGGVLYEMLTGHPVFSGQTTSDTIAAVLTADPNWARLPDQVPSRVRTLLHRCLEKDARQRLRDIGDARIEIDATAASTSPPVAAASSGRLPRVLAIAVGLIAVVALTWTATTWMRSRSETPAVEPVHSTVLLPPGVTIGRGPGRILSLALSPDGRTLVVSGADAKGQRLYVRHLDRPEFTPLAGTEGALCPFFSPNGAWIGFFADRRLRRVPVGGGAAVDIAPVAGYPAGATWGIDDRIIFAAGYLSPLRVVKAAGGTPEPVTKLETGGGHSYPELLPDGRTLLFNEGTSIQAIDLTTGRRTTLESGRAARFVSSGHVILSRSTTVLAAPFDPSTLTFTSAVVAVLEGVAVERGSGGAPHIAVARNGTLAYVPSPLTYELVLLKPDGTEQRLSEDPLIENPRFSPTGQRLVVAAARRAGEMTDLWLHDLVSSAPASRLTTSGARAPVWTLDGLSITYSQLGPERPGIYTTAANGSEEPRSVVRLPNFHWLVGWNKTGILAFGMMENIAADGISRSSILTFEGGKTRHVVGPGDTWGGRLSPDGRWLAYYSLDSGNFEIYVTPFPNTGARQLVAEGTDPSWSPNGSEIYYRQGSRLMAAHLDRSAGVRVLSHRLVLEPFTPPLYDDYDIHPDGRTLAIVRPAGEARGREITLVQNGLAELTRRR